MIAEEIGSKSLIPVHDRPCFLAKSTAFLCELLSIDNIGISSTKRQSGWIRHSKQTSVLSRVETLGQKLADWNTAIPPVSLQMGRSLAQDVAAGMTEPHQDAFPVEIVRTAASSLTRLLSVR